MANLIQSETSLTYYQGWYGTLTETGEDLCEPFYLTEGDGSTPDESSKTSLIKKYPEILNVFEVSSDSITQLPYSGLMPDGLGQDFQQVKELKCGHSYLIVLKKGTGSVDIPKFTFATAGTSSYEYKIRSTI